MREEKGEMAFEIIFGGSFTSIFDSATIELEERRKGGESGLRTHQ